jgi:hypothetical protein
MSLPYICNRANCKRYAFKVGELFYYDGNGVVCSRCWNRGPDFTVWGSDNIKVVKNNGRR